MRIKVDFDILVGPTNSYADVMGDIEITGLPDVGERYALPLDKEVALGLGIEPTLPVTSVKSFDTDGEKETIVFLETVILGSVEDARKLTGALRAAGYHVFSDE